jgi:hypothetical protein
LTYLLQKKAEDISNVAEKARQKKVGVGIQSAFPQQKQQA